MNIPTSQQRAARRATRLTAAALAVAMLGGCAALSPDAGTADVQALVAGRTGAGSFRQAKKSIRLKISTAIDLI